MGNSRNHLLQAVEEIDEGTGCSVTIIVRFDLFDSVAGDPEIVNVAELFRLPRKLRPCVGDSLYQVIKVRLSVTTRFHLLTVRSKLRKHCFKLTAISGQKRMKNSSYRAGILFGAVK